MLLEPVQQTLDVGVPLTDVAFCVVDLETTGGSPTEAAITEIGAVLLRGGEVEGTFQTLVQPGMPIPPFVAQLTGITDAMVADAPPIGAVLPSFVEFSRGAVIVAHNATFDVSFLNAALIREDRDPLPEPAICTARLARRLVWPEVPNVRLGTLAAHFRTGTTPSHRALDDAKATAEILHRMLDLGARLGITTLGDLREAIRSGNRPHFGKIRLADDLPRSTGVYLFRDREGRVLYVGKSRDVRTRVRTYFYGDPRRKVANLLAATASVDAQACASEVEALALEARLIREHRPRYNRRGTTWRSYAYVRLDLREAYPRLKVVRDPGDGEGVLGPFASSARAHLAKEALEDLFPIRRCTTPMGPRTRFPACVLGDMHRCVAPCIDRVDAERYRGIARALADAMEDPADLLTRLEARMEALGSSGRYEEAAAARERLRVLVDVMGRARQDRWLTAGTIELRDADGADVAVRGGAVGAAADPIALPCPRERADELGVTRSWLARGDARIVGLDGPPPAEPVRGGRELHRLASRLRAVDAYEERRAGRERGRGQSPSRAAADAAAST